MANPLNDITKVLGANSPASGAPSQSNPLNEQLTTITQQLQQLQTINQTQIATMQTNTQAVSQNTSVKAQGGGSSTASNIGNTLQDVLGFGLGLSPLISGLVSLFGGGGSSALPPLTPYIAPLPIHASAGIGASNPGSVFAVDNAAGGVPRPAPAPVAPQITVQVQALDSQSFLDHSGDIAMAVRQAMLESSVLNDVIREI
jgi:hypothetical protein